jgi:hypothetical protein
MIGRHVPENEIRNAFRFLLVPPETEIMIMGWTSIWL